ncbi:autotransporter outer membrane beta-barrel domain-containing protein [Quatrionicoccus australiensis]|uniref:autotransporter outer membrane beta-barrel domain-containing protein n=1 Tax=Quatrionicoccus australiensis TaxID=138118 RepID=UPI001CFAF58F|nr:autotransporter domain-containing protein [Quatrionicoccus australiensis]MCB4361073.1 autotransporter domain-containing protein [Quatrionicoccus australiensis]
MKERNQMFRIVKLGGKAAAIAVGILGTSVHAGTFNVTSSNFNLSDDPNMPGSTAIYFTGPDAVYTGYTLTSITGNTVTNNSGEGSLYAFSGGVTSPLVITGDVGSDSSRLREIITGRALTINGATFLAGDLQLGSHVPTLDLNGDLNISSSGRLLALATPQINVADGVNITTGSFWGLNGHATLNFLGSSTINGAFTDSGFTPDSANTFIINAGADGKTVTFQQKVIAYSLNLSGTGTVELNAGLTGDLDGQNKSGTIVLGDAQTISGTISNTGKATLRYAGDGTVSNTSGIWSTIEAGADSKTVDFTVGNAASTVKLLGPGTINLNGGLAGNLDMNNKAGTVNLADAKDLTGTVSSPLGRNGTLNVLGTSTITGTVAGLNTINAGETGKIATFSSSVDASTLNLSGTGTIKLNGGLIGNINFNNKAGTVVLANNQNLTGDVQNTGNTVTGSTLTFAGSSVVKGNVAGVDVINAGVDGSVVSVSGSLAANTLNMTGSGTLNTAGGMTLSGALTLGSSGTLELGSGTSKVGEFNSSSLGWIKVDAAGNGSAFTSNGKIVARAGSMSGYELLTVNMTGGVANGAKFRLIDFTGGMNAKTLMSKHVSTNSATLTFTAQSGDNDGNKLNSAEGAAGEDLWVLASAASGANYTSSGNVTSSNPSASAGNVLSNIANTNGGTGDMQTVVNTFNMYSAAQLNSEVQKLAPVSNNALTSASLSTVNAGLSTVSGRLANLRGEQLASAGQTGLSAGDDERGRSVWLKGFGSWGQQDAKDAYSGYKANSAGVSLGADTLVGASNLRLGAAFSYAGTGVAQQDQRHGDGTNITSYQGTFYAMKEFGAAYVDGLLAYARHDYKSHRATALSRTASGNWSGTQLSARLDSGYRIPLGVTTVTPLASLEWSQLKQDAYTETGAGALNLNVDAASNTRLRSGLGARLQADTFVAGMAVKPEARVVWFHDFKDAGTDTTSTYTGGGASFLTPGQKIEKDAINLGLGVTVQPNKLAKFSLNYDFEGRSGYQSHALQLSGRWDF